MTNKQCSKCKQVQPMDQFNKAPLLSTGLTSQCKTCKNDGARFRRYGITRERYEAMLDEQNGKCAICGSTDPGGNIGQSGPQFAIDHDHTTGELRGLLCRACNVGIGNLGDDPERLLNAATYLLSFKNLVRAELP